ncbi:MAG: DNA polymerase III subunit beta, partial [Dysgonomonas mossii]|nr:DNA polymerase III subunit beta [Dysgonomonas mossii]
EIKFDENNAYIKMSSYTMTCRFIEGRYPNYNSVIPQNNPNKVILDRLSFLNALKRVSVFSNQASNLIRLQLSDKNIIVSAQDIDFSTAAEETIPCDYTGTPMSIGFKSSFLIDILNNIPSSDISLELSDPSRAGLIIPAENEENEDLLMLLMPMMLND